MTLTDDEQHFEPDTEHRIHKHLSKWFNAADTVDEDSWFNDDCPPDAATMDKTRVMAICPRSDAMRRVCARYGPGNKYRLPKIDGGGGNKSAYAANYIHAAHQILAATTDDTNNAPKNLVGGDTITITVYGDDYPIEISNQHARILIAPRIEST